MSSKIENQKKKILVVDDDPDAVKVVVKSLESEGYPVEVANTGREAIDLVNAGQPHLVLLDINMPGLNGIDTLKYLRARNEYVSTIFVSGQSDTEDVVKGLDAGADDYICKPFDPIELLARVRSQLRIKVLNDKLTQANCRLRELVDIDDLTGLFNMRSLYQRLDNELNRAIRYKRSVCVLMLDMDHFKTVNDGHDHLFGSYVLSQMGKIIKDNIRKIDFGARYGGDEFLIVLTEVTLKGAEVFAERLRTVIENTVFSSDGHKKQLTVSVGLAITPEEGHPDIDARTLVRQADRALYQAKADGRNCVRSDDFSAGEDLGPVVDQALLRK